MVVLTFFDEDIAVEVEHAVLFAGRLAAIVVAVCF